MSEVKMSIADAMRSVMTQLREKTDANNKVLELKPGDVVRHKRVKKLERGLLTSIQKTPDGKKFALVFWKLRKNPQIKRSYGAWYRLDLLEKVK